MKAGLPHILLLVTDQFRHDAVSPMITPNLYDFTQWNGTTSFQHAYTSVPICTPARAALLTGKSPWSHGMLAPDLYTNCEKYPTTIPRVLKDLRGYETVAIGKNHFGPIKHIHGYQTEIVYDALSQYLDDYDIYFNDTMPNMDPKATCGLDWNDWMACPYWYDEYMHPTAWTTRTALKTLEEHIPTMKDKPILFKVSYHRPHSPYDPPRRILDQYLNSEGPKGSLAQLQRHVNDSSWDLRFKDYPMTASSWAGDPGDAAARHSRAGYLASVEFVDEQIGLLFKHLKSRGLLDQFWIIWTSDHGDQNGDHYLWRKGYPWESSAHIFMAMTQPPNVSQHNSTPPRPPPKVSDALVENRDIAPTIYDALGLLDQVKHMDPLMDGKSLLPILTSRTATTQNENGRLRDWLDLEHGIVFNVTNHWNALVGYWTQDNASSSSLSTKCNYWKYIFHAYDASEQLFCLETDPHEWYDLATLTEFQTALEVWRKRMVVQFETEGRGSHWVQNGTLQVRTTQTTFGPNFACLSQSERLSSSFS